MERNELVSALNEVLAELDALAEGEALEELAAELEDAIFLLECAEDDEELNGALEEIAGLAGELRMLSNGNTALFATSEKLRKLAN